jgi:hypothetical protein
LLRCWEECEAVTGERVWRFSLEHARTGQRRGFISLSDLTAALQSELASDRPAGPDIKGEKDMS